MRLQDDLSGEESHAQGKIPHAVIYMVVYKTQTKQERVRIVVTRVWVDGRWGRETLFKGYRVKNETWCYRVEQSNCT
jgi:hypothetical protein